MPVSAAYRRQKMTNNSIAAIDFGVIAIYVLMLLGVGYYVYRRETSFEEYLLAGRTMTTPILICLLGFLVGNQFGTDYAGGKNSKVST